jgi:hypothetical protein
MDGRARPNDVIDETLAAYEVEPLGAQVHAEIQDLFRRTCQEEDVTLPAPTETANA